MDSEKGQSPSPTGKPSRNTSCCRHVLLVIAITMGTLALALSACALALQIVSMQQPSDAQELQYTSKQEQQLLHEVAQFLHKTEFNETANRKVRGTGCSSSYDTTKTVKPSAHIAGKSWGASDVPFIDIFGFELKPVISVGWDCDKERRSHVLGGMKYNTDNGFLKVPADGVYFVYSQIFLNVTSPDSSSPTNLGHITVKCTCKEETQIDSDDGCNCYSVENTLPYIGSMPENLMYSYSQNRASRGSSTYHGGLFQLTANDYIAVVPVLPKSEAKLSIIAMTTDSFFGAFYVTGLTAPTVTPSPTL